jgi:hypothetical protein
VLEYVLPFERRAGAIAQSICIAAIARFPGAKRNHAGNRSRWPSISSRRLNTTPSVHHLGINAGDRLVTFAYLESVG